MNDNWKKKTLLYPAKYIFNNFQMAVAANGQKLRKPLHQAEDESLKPIHYWLLENGGYF